MRGRGRGRGPLAAAAPPRRLSAANADARRPRACLRPGCRSGASEHAEADLDDRGVELRPGAFEQAAARLLDRERLAIRPGRRHRVERIADEDDPGLERDLVTHAGRPGTRRRRSARGRRGRSDARARAARSARGSALRARGASRSAPVSSSVSGPGLVRISSGIPIFPMSWNSAPSSTRFRVAASEPELLADVHGHVPDPARVRGGVLVLRLERVGERLDGREERALEALEGARVGERKLRLSCDAGEQVEPSSVERLAPRSASASPPWLPSIGNGASGIRGGERRA